MQNPRWGVLGWLLDLPASGSEQAEGTKAEVTQLIVKNHSVGDFLEPNCVLKQAEKSKEKIMKKIHKHD